MSNSRDKKLNYLHRYWLKHKSMDNVEAIKLECPFQDYSKYKYNFCAELCGDFEEISFPTGIESHVNCPCLVVGPKRSMKLLKELLVKEGLLEN